MIKTPKQLVKELREEFNNAINRLKENYNALTEKEAFGTIFKVIWEQGKPLRVLVDMDPDYRPKQIPLSEIYLFGAPLETPLKGTYIEMMTPIEHIVSIYGANLEKALLGKSVRIIYKASNINAAKCYIWNKQLHQLDTRYMFPSETCGKQYGKYSGV